MATAPLMPKATAVWLVENTSLSFDQIAQLCNLHPLEVKAIADGDAAQGIKGLDPIVTGQLTREEIADAEAHPTHRLHIADPKVRLPEAKQKKGPRYTPVSRRQDRPNAILWLVRNHPELKDAQIMRLVGTTKTTIASVRDRTHWNASTLTPMDPVTLGLCSQIELDFEVQRAAKEKPADTAYGGATLLPVDSEHNAIWQCFDLARADTIERIILTASGGPFRERAFEEMRAVTPQEAVAHPNWNMGAKISVDSATMMNKGLELIEAHHLFQLPLERVDIVVHPQSIVHGAVVYRDGSVLAQLGSPDMRTPIAYALAWPDRIETPAKRLDLAAIGRLTFEPPDEDRFPALRVAREALLRGGGCPTVLNAANETAVHAFLEGRIGFLDIVETVERTLEAIPEGALESLDDVYNFDKTAREIAGRFSSLRNSTPATARTDLS